MKRPMLFLILGTVIAGLTLALETGCPPDDQEVLQKIIVKSLSKGGCRGCDSCEPEEGEGEGEGEGEMVPEGEGEALVEGEVEEGEGEAAVFSLILGLGAVNPTYIHGTIIADPQPEAFCPPLEGQPWCGRYYAGTRVELTPEPYTGYVFNHWTGDLSGSDVPGVVVIDGTKHIQAEFTAVGEGEEEGEGEVAVEGEGEIPGEGELPAEGEVEGEGETDHTGDVVVLLPGDVPLAMMRIPSGSFMMGHYPAEENSYGQEEPQHEVTLAQDFLMGKYEVTKAQWMAVMEEVPPWSGQSYVLDNPESPAVYVSWNEAQSFITALNEHVTNTGQGTPTFRMPSEAEWEYACRAGTETRYYWGDDLETTLINEYAWWDGNADGVGEDYAHVVGLKLPNAFGLYDMSGNALEWCEDDEHNNYTGAPTDGSAWVDSPRALYRILRGGYWAYLAINCRSAYRSTVARPTNSKNYTGFRLARS